MNESFPGQPSRHESTLKSWREGPVILASGSDYKMQGVRSLGMNDVTAQPVAEEVETNIFERIQDHQDERVAMYVAEAKVHAVLEQGVPADALVCAFDTVALSTKREEGRRTRQHLQKPSSREEAKQNLLDLFMYIADQKKWQDKLQAPLLTEARKFPNFDDIENSMRVGNPESLIVVATGMAARLPGDGSTTHTGISSARLELHSLYAFAQAGKIEQRKQFTSLVEEALQIMDEGARWKKVTGGIDFADPRIIELLGIDELRVLRELPKSEEGVFRGMPQEAFKDFLRALAREESKKV